MAKKRLTADFDDHDWERFIKSVHRGREFIPELLNDEQWRSFVFAAEGPFKNSPPVTIAQADFFSKASEHFRDVVKEATGVTIREVVRSDGRTQTIAQDERGRFVSPGGTIERFFGR